MDLALVGMTSVSQESYDEKSCAYLVTKKQKALTLNIKTVSDFLAPICTPQSQASCHHSNSPSLVSNNPYVCTVRPSNSKTQKKMVKYQKYPKNSWWQVWPKPNFCSLASGHGLAPDSLPPDFKQKPHINRTWTVLESPWIQLWILWFINIYIQYC